MTAIRSVCTDAPVATGWTQRAQPLLGTVVIVRLARGAGAPAGEADQDAAFAAAFAAVCRVGQAMSAHHPDSDLGRIARARPGSVLRVDPQTVEVLRLARYWHGVSGGAFNSVRAAAQLQRRGERPAFAEAPLDGAATLHDLDLTAVDEIVVHRPLWVDLGGLAKGYAVDQAIAALQRQGVTDALVNAGGDLRAIGGLAWPVAFRHDGAAPWPSRRRGLTHLHDAALASSEANPAAGFVAMRRRPTTQWSACSVLARDCASADALTKWGLQAPEPALALRRALHAHRARLWRSC